MLSLWNDSSNGSRGQRRRDDEGPRLADRRRRVGYGLTPAADVLETEAGFRVVLDLAGPRPEGDPDPGRDDVPRCRRSASSPSLKDAALHRSERRSGRTAGRSRSRSPWTRPGSRRATRTASSPSSSKRAEAKPPRRIQAT